MGSSQPSQAPEPPDATLAAGKDGAASSDTVSGGTVSGDPVTSNGAAASSAGKDSAGKDSAGKDADDEDADDSDDEGGAAGGTGDKASAAPVAVRKRPFWRELFIIVAAALVLTVVIKVFLFQVFSIPSASMENTLMPGDRILVNRLVYHLRGIDRGDIVVFSGDGSWGPPPPPARATRCSAPGMTSPTSSGSPRRARTTSSA